MVERCRRVETYEEARTLTKDEEWHLLVEKSVDYTKPYALLPSAIDWLWCLEGSWVKLDAIVCQLRTVALPPRWSFFYWPNDGGNYYWFLLGRYHNIYIPR